MDLPSCRACGQSVLDDDAQQCPFCGADMKTGKGGKAAAPARSAPKAPAASKPPAKASSGSSKPGARPLPAVTSPSGKSSARDTAEQSDDPFAVDPRAHEKAHSVSQKSGGNRTLEVTCPMCESTGYVTAAASGQPVRCWNGECLVPIFTAPIIKKEVVVPPPPPRNYGMLLIGASIVLIVAVSAGAYWYLTNDPTARPKPPGDDVVYLPEHPEGNSDPEISPEPGTPTDTEPAPKTPEKAAVENVDWQRQVRERLVEAARRSPPSRRPYSRRVTVMAFASDDQLTAAREQLEQLRLLGDEARADLVLPLVSMAWNDLAHGREAEFVKGIDEAASHAAHLPRRGQYAIEAATAVAAGLAATGRHAPAQAMLAAHRSGPGEVGVTSTAAAFQIVQHDRTYDLDAPLLGRSQGAWFAPQEIAVVLTLAAHHRWDAAINWSLEATDPAVRSECGVVCGEALARAALTAKQPSELQRAVELANQLPPAAKARLLARIAFQQSAAGDRTGAGETLTQAQAVLDGVPVPQPLPIESIRQLLNLKLPEPFSLQFAALAAADIATVQAQLGDSDGAWTRLMSALGYLRATTPSPSILRQHLKQIETAGDASMRRQLRTELELESDEQARRELIKYKQACGDLLQKSLQRFELQERLLIAAIPLPLGDRLWNEIQALHADPDPNRQEPFLEVSLPYLLAAHQEAAGNVAQAQAIQAALEQQKRPETALPLVRAETARQIAAGQVTQAAESLNKFTAAGGVLDEWVAALACRLAKERQLDKLMSFLAAVRDVPLREEASRTAAALAAQRGDGEALFKLVSGLERSQPEMAALCAGITIGLSPQPQTPPPAAPAPDPAAKTALAK